MTRPNPTRPRYTGPGMTASNMRANGVRNILVSCSDCHHEALLNLDHMSDHVEIHSLDNRLVCKKAITQISSDFVYFIAVSCKEGASLAASLFTSPCLSPRPRRQIPATVAMAKSLPAGRVLAHVEQLLRSPSARYLVRVFRRAGRQSCGWPIGSTRNASTRHIVLNISLPVLPFGRPLGLPDFPLLKGIVLNGYPIECAQILELTSLLPSRARVLCAGSCHYVLRGS
jgi:hypothetical protein